MATIETRTARQTVFVDTFTDGTLGPDVPMLGPVADGGHIVVNTTPGCWGPMITPSIRGGHEVCTPVAVVGEQLGTHAVLGRQCREQLVARRLTGERTARRLVRVMLDHQRAR